MKTILLTSTLAFSLIGPGSSYELHEWGTFTSVSGSDGKLLAGLTKEEEKLPNFVHTHAGMENVGPQNLFSKGFSATRPFRNVKIKMETPVIYFYSDEPFKASVEVGFNGGSISQWFPQRSSGETVPKITKRHIEMTQTGHRLSEAHFKEGGGIDFAKPFQGNIKWDLEVLPPDVPRSLSFKPHETLNWVRPRNHKANILKVGNQYEDYLFYRGVGNFELPVTFRVDENETLHIENTGDEDIPFFFVQEDIPGKGVRFHTSTDGLKTGSSISLTEADLGQIIGKWQHPVYDAMTEGLLKTGLTREETDSMIQTWWHSYFHKPGLRVFWIVPEKKTEEILPLKVSPAPEKMVRVIVGRSEVLRPRFEKQLLAGYEKRNDKKEAHLWINQLNNRYGIAYQKRVQELLDKKVAAK